MITPPLAPLYRWLPVEPEHKYCSLHDGNYEDSHGKRTLSLHVLLATWEEGGMEYVWNGYGNENLGNGSESETKVMDD